MNARKEIRDALLVRKMEHWRLAARYPFVRKNCSTWRARKNYWAPVRKHEALAARHGLTVTSVF